MPSHLPPVDKRDWFVWSDTRPTGWTTFAGDPWRNNGNGWYYGSDGLRSPLHYMRNPGEPPWDGVYVATDK